MQTLICEKPGSLEYISRQIPVPAAGYALLKIKQVGICGTDLHAYQGDQPYFEYPRVLGHELAAEIADIGPNEYYAIGDRVTVIPYLHCGSCIACRQGLTNCCSQLKVLGVHLDGAMSEFISVPVSQIVKGNDFRFDELALVEPLAIGAHGIRRAAVQAGEFVLVMGAGPIGLGLMAFAAMTGASVIAMDVNEDRLAFCRENLSIPYTFNPLTEDPIQRLNQITGNDLPSVIIDATGNLGAINAAFQYLAHGGRYVLVGLQKGDILVNHPEFHKREAVLMSSRNATLHDFQFVMAAMKSRSVQPENFITHRVGFDAVKASINSWLDPGSKVIKAMVQMY
ncbi:MAG: alcohol dehydrogenase catalytic domain-containing protein [Terrimonas sp.]|nr:alcohol dehydrogenase catalytic domain-containing protein [Terrimonas sp.]